MSLKPSEPSAASDNGGVESLKLWSCVNCRRRKVRCDRRHPCAPCTKNKSECIYPVSGRLSRRLREVNHQPAVKRAELLGRLRRLEAMVGDLGAQVESVAEVSQNDQPEESSAITSSTAESRSIETELLDHHFTQYGQPTVANSSAAGDGMQVLSGLAGDLSEESQIPNELGELLTECNGDLVVADRFWTVFCKEVENIYKAVCCPTDTHVDESSSSSVMSISNHRRHGSFYNFLLKNTSAIHQEEDLHPLPSQMLFLWQTYSDNVDPFMKVLHIPTTTKVIRELKGSYKSLDPSMQALLLVVSLAAIISLGDQEVQVNFNIEKLQLVAHYQKRTENALEQAGILENPDLVLLQALTIYLGILQHNGEMRSAWFVAGVLVRIAVSLKLHYDGSHYPNLNPFEVEMRRRLWWQICFIDSRSEDVQAANYKISEGMFDTKMPTNTDDANLNPEMSRPPEVVEGWTDMTVFLIRCEFWKLSRRLESTAPVSDPVHRKVDDNRKIFEQARTRVECSYLKLLNPTSPFRSFVTTNARLFLTKVDLVLYTKQCSAYSTEPQPADSSQRQNLFLSSLSIIEYTYALQNEPNWSSWRWQIQGQQPPWHALLFVLNQLYTQDWESIYERAWCSAKRSLDALPESTLKDSQCQQLLKLVSAVQQIQSEKRHFQTSEIATHVNVDLTTATATTFPPLAQAGESLPTWMPQEPSSYISSINDSSDFDNCPISEIDWQIWEHNSFF